MRLFSNRKSRSNLSQESQSSPLVMSEKKNQDIYKNFIDKLKHNETNVRDLNNNETNVEDLKQFLEQKVREDFDLGTQGYDGHTILYHLVRLKTKDKNSLKYVQEKRLKYIVSNLKQGNLNAEGLKKEVEEGFDLGTVSSDNHTILYYLITLQTIDKKVEEIIQYVLRIKKGLLDIEDAEKQIPLDILLQSEHNNKFEISKLFIRSGSNNDIYKILVQKSAEGKLKKDDFSQEIIKAFDFSTMDNNQYTILHHLVRSEKQDIYNIIKHILTGKKEKHKKILNSPNKEKKTPLDLLLESERKGDKFKIAELLIPQWITDKDDQMNILKILVQKLRDKMLTKDDLESTIERGFDLGTKDSYGETILHRLVLSEEKCENIHKIIQYILFKNKELVNAKNQDSETPLDLLLQSQKKDKFKITESFMLHIDNIDLYKILVQQLKEGKLTHGYLAGKVGCNGFDLGTKDSDGNTILHHLAMVKLEEQQAYNKVYGILGYVISQKKVLVNEQNNEGNTPLHLVLKIKSPKYPYGYEYGIHFLKLSVQRNAKISIANNVGESVLDCVRTLTDLCVILSISSQDRYNLDYSVCCLEILKSNINVRSKRGITPLELVSQNAVSLALVRDDMKCYLKLYEFLVECNANINVQNEHTDNVLYTLALCNKTNITKLSVKLLSQITNKDDKIRCVDLLQGYLNKRDDIEPDGIIKAISTKLSIMLPQHNNETYDDLVNKLKNTSLQCKDLKRVVQVGFDLKTKDSDGNTILHHLILLGQKCKDTKKIIKDILAENEQLVNYQNHKGNTPLHLLLQSKCTLNDKCKILPLFGGNGDDIKMMTEKNQNGEDALYLITLCKMQEIYELSVALLSKMDDNVQNRCLNLLKKYLRAREGINENERSKIIQKIDRGLTRTSKRKNMNFFAQKLDDVKHWYDDVKHWCTKPWHTIGNFFKRNCGVIICVGLCVGLIALAVLNIMLLQVISAIKLIIAAVAIAVFYVIYCNVKDPIKEACNHSNPSINAAYNHISASINAAYSNVSSYFSNVPQNEEMIPEHDIIASQNKDQAKEDTTVPQDDQMSNDKQSDVSMLKTDNNTEIPNSVLHALLPPAAYCVLRARNECC